MVRCVCISLYEGERCGEYLQIKYEGGGVDGKVYSLDIVFVGMVFVVL